MTVSVDDNESNDIHKLVEGNLEHSKALALVKETEDLNISTYISGLPDELRNPHMDNFIEQLLRRE